MMSCKRRERSSTKLFGAQKLRSIIAAILIVFVVAGPMPATAKQTNDAQIKTWPQGKFPRLASWFNVEGHCDVRFSIDEEGYPFAVTPYCTWKVFCFDAKRAVSGATFIPKRIDGIPVIRTNVVYPMEYAFEGSSYDKADDPRSLELCEAKAVS